MLFISVILFIGYAITNSEGGNSKSVILKEPMRQFNVANSNIENLNSLKAEPNKNTSQYNETLTETFIGENQSSTESEIKLQIQSTVKNILSMKNYPLICNKGKELKVSIEPDFDFYTNNENIDCSKKSFLMFAVLSPILNFEQREKIRQSWGSIRQLQEKKITVIFFVYSEKEITANQKTIIEKERNDYLDTVLIMDLKSIRNEINVYFKLIQFAVFRCQVSEYFVLVMDYMFVNIPTLFEAILTHTDITKPGTHTRSIFLCKVKKNSMALRNAKNPWFVTNEEWSDKHYPPYCDMTGAMVTSYEVLRDILMCSYYTKRLWIADVFITGVLPQKLDVTVEDFLEDFSTSVMKNHHISGDISHNVFLTEGTNYTTQTWRLIFNRSLREI